MYQEMRTKDDAWMQSIHDSIDQLSEIIDSIPKDGVTLPSDDEYMCPICHHSLPRSQTAPVRTRRRAKRQIISSSFLSFSFLHHLFFTAVAPALLL